MSLSTYLTFDGKCREAFEFYRSVFGGAYQTLSTFGEGPEDMEVPEAERNKIMHVSLPVGGGVLMGSDRGPYGPPLVAGNNFSLSVESGSREASDALFSKLSAGGTVMMPMGDAFWGAYFGMCADKFGIHWMVSCEPAQE